MTDVPEDFVTIMLPNLPDTLDLLDQMVEREMEAFAASGLGSGPQVAGYGLIGYTLSQV
jgi:hypothetical protein